MTATATNGQLAPLISPAVASEPPTNNAFAIPGESDRHHLTRPKNARPNAIGESTSL